jgi:hydroxyethylthiazole kinase-like uncharacterized protein yjeF
MPALYLTETIRRIEHAWIDTLGGGVLMDRAADAIADAVSTIARRGPPGAPIVALAGPGNNGGDALLAALKLRARGHRVAALALTTALPEAADARAVRAGWDAAIGVPASLDTLPDWIARGALFIDGLFGIGLSRPIEGAAADAIRALAGLAPRVIAVDVPSGLDPDTGAIVGGTRGVAVRAGTTVTMIGDKPGLRTAGGLDLAGRVLVAPLGLHAWPDGQAFAPDGGLFLEEDAAALWRPRARNSHKGSFGSVTIIGGAAGTTGAALLAARGAQSMGAGRIWIASPDARVFDPGQPQWMTRAIDAPLEAMDALCVGCGLGRSEPARAALAGACASSRALALDADALNLIAEDPTLAQALGHRSAPTVLTPHPLEAARILGRGVPDVQADRIASARALAARTGAAVVLKGAGSVVATPDGGWTIIGSGSPALAVAGSGDVLAGMVTALLAQGHGAREAARLGVWLHGAAADAWEQTHPTGAGLSASELHTLVVERQQTLARP